MEGGLGGSGQPGADPEVARPVAPDVSGPDVLGVEPEMEPECRSVGRVLVCGLLATAAVALVIDVLSRTPLYIPNPHPILLTAARSPPRSSVGWPPGRRARR